MPLIEGHHLSRHEYCYNALTPPTHGRQYLDRNIKYYNSHCPQTATADTEPRSVEKTIVCSKNLENIVEELSMGLRFEVSRPFILVIALIIVTIY